jgi:hypothetical protein
MIEDIDKLSREIVGVIYLAENSSGKNFNTNMKDNLVINFKDKIMGKWPDNEIIPLMKKSVLKKIKFPGEGNGLEGIFWNNLLKSGRNILIRNVSLRIYHEENSDRLTGGKQTLKRAKNIIILYNYFLKEFEKDYLRYNPKRLAYFYLEKGIFELIDNQKSEGKKSLFKAIKYNNKKILLVILFYVLSFLPNILFIKLAIFGHKFKRILK